MPEERGQRRDHDDQWQNLEGERRHRLRVGNRKRRFAAARIAEDEGCTGARSRGQCVDGAVQRKEQCARGRNLEQQPGQCELKHKPAQHRTNGKGATILGQSPRQREDSHDARQ